MKVYILEHDDVRNQETNVVEVFDWIPRFDVLVAHLKQKFPDYALTETLYNHLIVADSVELHSGHYLRLTPWEVKSSRFTSEFRLRAQ